MVVCLICLFVPVAGDGLLAAAEKERAGVPTNFEAIERVSAEAAEDLAAGVGSVPKDGFVLLSRTKGSGDADFILENALVQRMKDAGIKVAIEEPKKDPSAGDTTGYRFAYQVVRLTVAYPAISRKFWLGSKEVKRAAHADVVARLVDLRTGEIVWTGESHKRYEDTIGYAKLSSVEDPQYEFTRPPRDEMKLSRIIEPLAVSGIVIGLVYLFFSNQGSE